MQGAASCQQGAASWRQGAASWRRADQWPEPVAAAAGSRLPQTHAARFKSIHHTRMPPNNILKCNYTQIEVIGVDGELKRVAQEALTARPNFAYTLKVGGGSGTAHCLALCWACAASLGA